MTPRALTDLIAAAVYALDVLDDYADVEDDDNCQPVANKAMLALTDLEAALKPFNNGLTVISKQQAVDIGLIPEWEGR
jgi:hypothetical protein